MMRLIGLDVKAGDAWYAYREIFDRVRTVIAEKGRINMLYGAESQDSVEDNEEIMASVESR